MFVHPGAAVEDTEKVCCLDSGQAVPTIPWRTLGGGHTLQEAITKNVFCQTGMAYFDLL